MSDAALNLLTFSLTLNALFIANIVFDTIAKRTLQKKIQRHDKEIISIQILCSFNVSASIGDFLRNYKVVFMQDTLEDGVEFKIQGTRKEIQKLENDFKNLLSCNQM